MAISSTCCRGGCAGLFGSMTARYCTIDTLSQACTPAVAANVYMHIYPLATILTTQSLAYPAWDLGKLKDVQRTSMVLEHTQHETWVIACMDSIPSMQGDLAIDRVGVPAISTMDQYGLCSD